MKNFNDGYFGGYIVGLCALAIFREILTYFGYNSTGFALFVATSFALYFFGRGFSRTVCGVSE